MLPAQSNTALIHATTCYKAAESTRVLRQPQESKLGSLLTLICNMLNKIRLKNMERYVHANRVCTC